MRQVHRNNNTPFLRGVDGSCTTLFRYPWVRIPQRTRGVEWAEYSFHTANFGRDSRASFANYGEGWCHSFLCLYQVMMIPCSYQVKRCFLACTRSRRFLVYTRSKDDSFLISRESTLFTPVSGVWWVLLGPV